MLHLLDPAGQGGLSKADLITCLASVFPLDQTTRVFRPDDLTAPFTRRASVSSMYGRDMYVVSCLSSSLFDRSLFSFFV